MIAKPYSALLTAIPSGMSFDAASTALPVSHTTFSYKTLGRRAAAASAAASAAVSVPADCPAAAFPQAAAAAVSSQTLTEASSPTNAGSQVGFLAQVIIAVGVIPLESIIVTIVLGVHRLVHRRSSRSLQTRIDSVYSAQDSLPYLQPKAELEDEQNRRHKLDGEHLTHELDREGKIFQIADETDSLHLPLQGR